MIRLEKTVSAWTTPEFEAVFKREAGQLDVTQLPLQQAMSQGSYASDQPLEVLVLGTTTRQGFIQVRAGLFYTGILPGCACSEDAAPDNEYTEYCEVIFDIDQQTAVATVSLLAG